mgnify:CR=1 FL=1
MLAVVVPPYKKPSRNRVPYKRFHTTGTQLRKRKKENKMIVVLKDNPDKKQLDNLVSWLKSMGLDIHFSEGQSATIMGLIGDTSVRLPFLLLLRPGRSGLLIRLSTDLRSPGSCLRRSSRL